MQFAAGEFLFAGDALHQEFVFRYFSAIKMVGRGAIKQDYGPFWRLAADCGRHASCLRNFTNAHVVGRIDDETAIFDFSTSRITFHNSFIALNFTSAAHRSIAVPAIAWESADVGNPRQFALTFSNHLHADLDFTVTGLETSGVFSLNRKLRPGLGGAEIGLGGIVGVVSSEGCGKQQRSQSGQERKFHCADPERNDGRNHLWAENGILDRAADAIGSDCKAFDHSRTRSSHGC